MPPGTPPNPGDDLGQAPEQLIVQYQGELSSATPPPVVARIESSSADESSPAPAGVAAGADTTPMPLAATTGRALRGALEKRSQPWRMGGHGRKVTGILAIFMGVGAATALLHGDRSAVPDRTEKGILRSESGDARNAGNNGDEEPYCDFDNGSDIFTAEGYVCRFSFPSVPDIAGLLSGKAQVDKSRPRDIVVVEGLFQATDLPTQHKPDDAPAAIEVTDCEAPIRISSSTRIEGWEEKVGQLIGEAGARGESFIPYDFSVEIIEQEKTAEGERRNHKVRITALLSNIEIYQKGDPERGIKDRNIPLMAGEETTIELDIQTIRGGCDFINSDLANDSNAAKVLAELILLALMGRRRR